MNDMNDTIKIHIPLSLFYKQISIFANSDSELELESTLNSNIGIIISGHISAIKNINMYDNIYFKYDGRQWKETSGFVFFDVSKMDIVKMSFR